MLPSRSLPNQDDLIAALVEMGYSVEQATRGLQIDGTIATAIEWISNDTAPNNDDTPNNKAGEVAGVVDIDVETAEMSNQLITAVVRPALPIETTQHQTDDQQQPQAHDDVPNTERVFLEQRILQASLRGASEGQDESDDGDPVVICDPQDEQSMSSLDASAEDSVRHYNTLSPDLRLSMTPTAHRSSAQYGSAYEDQERKEKEKMKYYQQPGAISVPGRGGKKRGQLYEEDYLEGSSSHGQSPSTSSRRRSRSSLKTRIMALVVVLVVVIVGAITIVTFLGSDDNKDNGSASTDTSKGERWSKFRSKLEYLSDDISVFDDPASPQYKALTWIANEDSIDVNIINQARLETRYALVVLYYATDGSHWLDQKSFLSPLHECSWTNTGELQGAQGAVACDSTFRVTGITLGKRVALSNCCKDTRDAICTFVSKANTISIDCSLSLSLCLSNCP